MHSQKFELTSLLCTASVQAQLLDLRSELTEAKADRSVVERELHEQLLQLHALQLQAKCGPAENSEASKNKVVRLVWSDPVATLQRNQRKTTVDRVGFDGLDRCFL